MARRDHSRGFRPVRPSARNRTASSPRRILPSPATRPVWQPRGNRIRTSPGSRITEPACTRMPPGRKCSKLLNAATASAFTPAGSVGRPGTCTSRRGNRRGHAAVNVAFQEPDRLLPRRVIPKVVCTWLSIRPGIAVVPPASITTSAFNTSLAEAVPDAAQSARPRTQSCRPRQTDSASRHSRCARCSRSPRASPSPQLALQTSPSCPFISLAANPPTR